MAGEFLTHYSNDPSIQIETNKAAGGNYWDPLLRTLYRQQTIYANGLVPFAMQQLPGGAQSMTVTYDMDFHPDTTELGMRDLT